MKVGEVKAVGDQGLKKKLLKQGQGFETPDYGDQVQVHYTATFLNGREFASSRDTDTPYKFTLGLGQVIKGWNLGIKTMKKGERAIFTIPAVLAYGQTGSPPTIPPNSTLNFDVELLSWVSVNDICEDGGIFKRILIQGETWQKPKNLDEVLVKFETRLVDGQLVCSSDGVEFKVKEGHFFPALAKAVTTMKKGEKALLIVKPQYGFGAKGKKASNDHGAVPCNAILLVIIELVSWKTISELADNKKISKQILKEGEDYDLPNDGAIVRVKLIGKLGNGTVFVKKGHDGEELFEFKVDKGQVVEGLDKAVMTMKRSEVAVVTIAPEYAFGSSESKQDLTMVPANSTVQYEIEMVSFEKEKESWDMNTEEKIFTANNLKEEGNVLFKAGKYARASKKYEKGAKYVEYDSGFSKEEKKQSKALKISCGLNNAACKLKLNEYKLAENLCTKVLELDSRNVKALYRRSQAYFNLTYFKLAEADIQKALEIDPENREVKVEHKKLKEKVKQYIKKQDIFYNNMFAEGKK